MAEYRILHIPRSAAQSDEGWVVQKMNLGGTWDLGSRLFPTKQEAQAEAEKLASADPS
jgi:hypothetical protein